MKKINFKDVRATRLDGTKDVEFRPLIAKDMNPPNYYMRLFDISPGGYTPRHSHAWEHEVYVVEGCGAVLIADEKTKLVAGDAVFIEPNDMHQFVNDGNAPLRLICTIPKPVGD